MTFKNKWTPEDKIRIVLESLNTNISLAELCRRNNLTPATFYQWRERSKVSGKAGLSEQLNDGVNKNLEQENERLRKLIGGSSRLQTTR